MLNKGGVMESQSISELPVEEKKSKKGLFLLVAIFLLLIFSLGGLYYYLKIFKKSTNTGSTSSLELADQKTSEEKAPENFVSMTLNGTTVYYPKAWGAPTKEITNESISHDPGQTFKGEYANFGGENWKQIVYVNDADSYAKDEYSNKVLTGLKNTYKNKAVDYESVYTNGSFLPLANAGIVEYAVRYFENSDASWRGYWFVGTEGQDLNVQPKFFGIMYNQALGKVISIRDYLTSSTAKQIEKKYLTEARTEADYQKAENVIETYVKGMYADPEIRSYVDSYDKLFLKFVK